MEIAINLKHWGCNLNRDVGNQNKKANLRERERERQREISRERENVARARSSPLQWKHSAVTTGSRE